MKRLIPALAVVCLSVVACSGDSEDSAPSTKSQVTETVTSTSEEPTTTVTVTQDRETVEQQTVTETVEPAPAPVMGYTEAPGQTTPTPMNKVIQSCGQKGLHERGTTFFTDGTSGWTEQCAAAME
ncbi:hypothetical protein [Corynebacterium gerontici]|uniref:Secreted protein n=1 Tax=Corynebacterium gerontici TaxID=2079234 RepID=A0A3G6IXH3_9CORY|nr:hypothetical protein [Corynebacterium gerontici]AZA10357.1 hypothetical protein CGERO_00090 [Corynebacterium gerontici]